MRLTHGKLTELANLDEVDAQEAQHGGRSIAEVVRLHSEALYTVYFLGAYPGLAYMAGLHPKLFTPRRAEQPVLPGASNAYTFLSLEPT